MYNSIFSVAFGELEISEITVFILVSLTVFIFVTVAVSSLSLFKFNDKDD